MLSPGPGIPDNAGLLKQVIATYAASKSILGVCLGQQAIAEVYGGTLINLDKVYHGVATKISIINSDEVLFKDLPQDFVVGRYHSWAANRQDFPNDLIITSVDQNGIIMSLKHCKYDVRGVQFHPESLLTPFGKKILENWINATFSKQ